MYILETRLQLNEVCRDDLKKLSSNPDGGNYWWTGPRSSVASNRAQVDSWCGGALPIIRKQIW